MCAFDQHPYRILLAEEINFMFTNREHSYFVADFIWSQDNVAGIRQQCTIEARTNENAMFKLNWLIQV